MIHAFDAGKFRWGDNPETTGIRENRGYYLWKVKGVGIWTMKNGKSVPIESLVWSWLIQRS